MYLVRTCFEMPSGSTGSFSGTEPCHLETLNKQFSIQKCEKIFCAETGHREDESRFGGEIVVVCFVFFFSFYFVCLFVAFDYLSNRATLSSEKKRSPLASYLLRVKTLDRMWQQV